MTNIMRHPSDGRSRYPAAADAKRPACASRPDQKAHEARAAAGVTSSRSNDAGTGMEPIPTPQKKRSAISMAIENGRAADSSEEHTSELQSLMRNSYAAFSLKTNTY